MNELQIFNYQSSEVRTVMKGGEPWFCLTDVCKALGLGSPHKVAERLDPDELTGIKFRSGGQTREMTFINESDLYNVILRSDKPEARPFRKWVTSEVLPSIRKTGQYSKGQLPPDKAALAEAKLNNSRARLASVWLKLAQVNPIPEYQQICAHHASAVLAGREVLSLPETPERTYTAAEVGAMLGGISANKVGRMANEHHLKTPDYGVQVWDKSPHSSKQVPTWRYNDKAVEKFRSLMSAEVDI